MPAPTPPAASPAEPPVELPSIAPPSDAPPASAPPEVAPVPVPAPEGPPATGNAAFAPLSKEPSAKSEPKPSLSGAAAPSTNPRPASSHAEGNAEPAVVHHQEEPEKDDDGGGLLGPLRIGLLVGGGLPEILSLGGQIKLTRFVGAGVNIGLIPTVKISYYGDATLSYQEYDAYGRVYPFGGAFFLGAGVGYATIKGTVSSKLNTDAAQGMYSGIPNPILVDSQGSVRTLVFTPQIGFMKIFGSGFTIGLDVGAQLPIAPSKVDFATTTNLPEQANSYVQSTYIKPNDDKVRSTLDTIGRTPLPTFNLKIGWFL